MKSSTRLAVDSKPAIAPELLQLLNSCNFCIRCVKFAGKKERKNEIRRKNPAHAPPIRHIKVRLLGMSMVPAARPDELNTGPWTGSPS